MAFEKIPQMKRNYADWMNKHFDEYQDCGRKGSVSDVIECMKGLKGKKDPVAKYNANVE